MFKKNKIIQNKIILITTLFKKDNIVSLFPAMAMVYLILKKNKNDFAVFQQSILFTWPPFYLRIGVHARTTILIDTTLFKTSFMLTRFIFQNDTGLVNLMLYYPIP